MAADHNTFANLIWQIADLLRGPYRPPQYERVMLPVTVLRRFDCGLTETKVAVVAEHERSKGGKLAGDALDTVCATTERTLALLKEHRSALIVAAVTGQLDVGVPQ